MMHVKAIGQCTIVPMMPQNPKETVMAETAAHPARVDYRTDPTQYRHWKLSVEGSVARLSLDIAEEGGIRPGYQLTLTSYGLGVDVELHDALNRVRFEHPEVRSVIVTSAKDRIFCSG